MKLKLFTRRSLLTNETDPAVIVLPLWKDIEVDNELFNRYIDQSRSIFEYTSLEDSDFVVVPADWEPLLSSGQELIAEKLIQVAKEAGKPTISFFSGDRSHQPIPAETDIIFRQSLYKSIKQARDYALPAWSEDLLKKYLQEQIPIRRKKAFPTVGFCGFVNRTKIKTYAKFYAVQAFNKVKKKLALQSIPPLSIGHILRAKALNLLSANSSILDNFILREESVFFQETNELSRESLRKEFVNNMVDSDYILCCRGSGNYSFRLYETLSCGRIPIFINTDCVLPYDFEIDWKKYCVWVEQEELPNIADKVLEFHENISPQEFVELQYECRRLWEERITPTAFFQNLYRHPKLMSLTQANRQANAKTP